MGRMTCIIYYLDSIETQHIVGYSEMYRCRNIFDEVEQEKLVLWNIYILPYSNSLYFRYILYSCPLNHDDGRVSYPLCFIFLSPSGKCVF